MVSARRIRRCGYDADTEPQLVVANLAHATLVATSCALHRAHPILGTLRPGWDRAPFARHELSDSEHLAQLVLLAIDELAERLDDYAASLDDNAVADDLLPFGSRRAADA
jgi:hypothetical protein